METYRIKNWRADKRFEAAGELTCIGRPGQIYHQAYVDPSWPYDDPIWHYDTENIIYRRSTQDTFATATAHGEAAGVVWSIEAFIDTNLTDYVEITDMAVLKAKYPFITNWAREDAYDGSQYVNYGGVLYGDGVSTATPPEYFDQQWVAGLWCVWSNVWMKCISDYPEPPEPYVPYSINPGNVAYWAEVTDQEKFDEQRWTQVRIGRTFYDMYYRGTVGTDLVYLCKHVAVVREHVMEFWGRLRYGGITDDYDDPFYWKYWWGIGDPISFSFEVHGASDLIYKAESETGVSALWTGVCNVSAWKGAGRDNGEMSLFGDETLEVYDEIVHPVASLTIDGETVFFDDENTPASSSNLNAVTLRVDGVWQATPLASVEYIRDYIIQPVNSMFWFSTDDNLEMDWGWVSNTANFRDTPVAADRDYSDTISLYGNTQWGKSPTDAPYPSNAGSLSTSLRSGIICVVGGMHGYVDSGSGYGRVYGARPYVSGYDSDGVLFESYSVYSGGYTCNYGTEVNNMWGSARDDLSVKGLERHPREIKTAITTPGVTGYTYAYEFTDEFDVPIPFRDILSSGTKTGEDPGIVLYGGKFECSAKLGEFLDLPNDGSAAEFVQHGAFKVQNVRSVYSGDTIDPDYNPLDEGITNNEWSEPAGGCPTHPIWIPYNTIYWYTLDGEWSDAYKEMTGEYSYEIHPDSLPWWDDRCYISAGGLSLPQACIIRFPSGTDTDDEVIIAQPVYFKYGDWTITGGTTSVSGDYRIVQQTSYITPAVISCEFDDYTRLTGARFAHLNWKTPGTVGFTLRIGDDTIGYHEWDVVVPAGQDPLNEIHSVIDLAIPDRSTVTVNPNMQSIIPYEQPIDASQSQAGLGGERQSDESYYTSMFGPGWGVGRIHKITITITANAGTTYRFKNIDLFWKSSQDGGTRMVYVLPHQVWIDDRDIDSYVLQNSGINLVTNSTSPYATHENELRIFPKALVVVDGAVICEIPAGYLELDHQYDNSAVVDGPQYCYHPFLISGGVEAYPSDYGVNRKSILSNGIAAIDVDDSHWDDFIKENSYVSFLDGGHEDFMGYDSLTLGATLRMNKLKSLMGLGVTPCSLLHDQQGAAYGIAPLMRSTAITVTDPDCSPGFDDTRSVYVDKLGVWHTWPWNTKNELRLDSDDYMVKIDNRYLTRFVSYTTPTPGGPPGILFNLGETGEPILFNRLVTGEPIMYID